MSEMHQLRERNARLEAENSNLLQEIALDDLTGALSARGFEMYLESRETPPMGLLVVDATNFKAVNDTYGHQRGDQLLKDMATTLHNSIRSTDVVARIGGDEFIVAFSADARDENKVKVSPEELIALTKERIKENTDELIASQPELGNAGFNIAVGGHAWESNKSMEEVVRKAELDMMSNKSDQHKTNGKYR